MRTLLRVEQVGCLIFAALVCTACAPSPSLFAQSQAEIQTVKSMVCRADSERQSLIRLSQASDEKAVNGIVLQQRSWSPIGRIIIATRLYQLDAKEGAEAVLKALPTSDVEMEAFDEFAYEPQNSALRPLYRAYYEAAFKSVIAHPEYLHAVFSVAREFNTKDWPDYDDIDWYCSNLAKVYKAIPKQYEQALAREDPRNRDGLKSCGLGH